jgi:hypothetical protein
MFNFVSCISSPGVFMDRRRSTNLDEMYALYTEGHSLESVGKVFKRTRQSVYGLFKYNNKPMRGKPKPLPVVEFNGNKYTMRNTGYYGRTNAERSLLHRDMWEFHNGPIPDGWDIHHVNEDPTDNRIENFECLPKAEHTRKYSPHNNQFTTGRKRR